MEPRYYFLLFVVDDDGNPVDAKNITAVASKKYRCRQAKATPISTENAGAIKNESDDQYSRSLG